jgi:hypothetical protein
MSQNDQNRDPQDQEEGYQDQSGDGSTRETRGDSSSDSARPGQGSQRQDPISDVDDEADDMDEDRDEDSRIDGGTNRRNNIG